MVPILIVAFIGLAAAIAWLSYQRKKRRREALAALALRSGLRFSRDDPFGLDEQDFHLFRLGDGRGCENVVWGDWKGLPVKAADYWYYTRSTDAQGHTTRSYRYFTIVEADLPCSAPRISIERESMFSRLADHLGFADIEFESEAFNRAFQVRAEDREFAFRLVDGRMMEWLMNETEEAAFELAGSNLLVSCSRRRPEELEAVFATAAAFRDHIPRLVWNEFGTEQPKGSLSSERSAS